MASPNRDAAPEGGGEWVYTRRFWHWRAKRYIYARPGRVFRFRRKRK